MKLSKGLILFLFCLMLVALPGRVWAQSGSAGGSTPTVAPTAAVGTPAAVQPTADVPKGVVTGKVINKNDASKPVGDLEVMLHVVDQQQNELGMLHGKSTQDGSYKIADVPFQEGIGYVAAVAYAGTTYYSEYAPAQAGKTDLNIDVPVYESTTDLSKIQIDQMHVLFSFASDGMDVKELYALSNLGDRTVKDVVDVPEKSGTKGTLKLPLPEKADFINFQPQDEARFVKFPGGFIDTGALVPGKMVSQFIVGYLLPYSDPLTYQLKTVLPVQAINFVLPKASGVTLKGAGLGNPEEITSQQGDLYYLYKLQNIPAGKTLDITFDGKPVIPQGQAASAGAAASAATVPNQQMPLFIGLGVLGAVLIGGGAFWWVRSARNAESADEEPDGLDADQEFDQLLAEIAQLDQRFEQGEIEEAAYQEQRSLLKAQAKAAQSSAAEASVSAEPEPAVSEAGPAVNEHGPAEN